MLTFFKRKKIFIPLLIVIFLAAFLRFNRLSDIYIFTFDEEYQATYAWTLVKDFHPIWIGVSSALKDYYMGPLFTYFTAMLLAISGGDPIFTAYFAAATGIITCLLIFFIGWKFFNLTVGFIASLLYATLPLIVFYDQKYWNPMFAPLIILLMFITLNLVRRSHWWWVFFAFLGGLILETELAPAPLVLVGLWYFIKGGYWKNIKLLFFCFLAFILLYWPLLVFDYYHNWSNVTVLARLYQQINQSQLNFDPLSKFNSLFDSLGRFWYLNAGNPNADEINISCTSLSIKPEFRFIDQYAERTYAPLWLSIISSGMILVFLWLGFRSKNPQYKLLAIFMTVMTIAYFIYPGTPFEYHNLGLLTLTTLAIGILISHINTKYRWIFVVILILPVALGVDTLLKVSDKFSLGSKKILITRVMNYVQNETFSIEGEGVCHNYEGWRYLFKVYGKTPTRSYTDHNFGWLYPDELSIDPVAYLVILTESRLPLSRDLSNYNKIDSGGYSAYIRRVGE